MSDELGNSGNVETGGGAGGGEVSKPPAGGEAPNVGAEADVAGRTVEDAGSAGVEEADGARAEAGAEGAPEATKPADAGEPGSAATGDRAIAVPREGNEAPKRDTPDVRVTGEANAQRDDAGDDDAGAGDADAGGKGEATEQQRNATAAGGSEEVDSEVALAKGTGDASQASSGERQSPPVAERESGDQGGARSTEPAEKQDDDVNLHGCPPQGDEGTATEQTAAEQNRRERSPQDVSRGLLDKAREAESQVTADLQKAAGERGGTMEGLEHRLKSEESLSRKLGDEALARGISYEEAGARNKDTLRYTMTFPPDQLGQSARVVLGDLESQGYRIDEAKNYWHDDNPYKGVNTVLTSPGGQRFELQFHTPESFSAKMEMHAKYEEFRLPQTSVDRKQQLFDEMQRASGRLESPRDIRGVGRLTAISRPRGGV